jgi:hypothetical protein
MSPLLATHRGYSFAAFQQLVAAANPTQGRLQRSSLHELEQLLQTLGANAPTSLARIQPVWGAVPRDKQLKYKDAGDYLKKHVPGLVDAIPVDPVMTYDEFRVMTGNVGGNANYPMRYYHVHTLTWKSSNGDMESLAKVGTRERVTHRTSPAGPPFDATMNAGIPMSFTQGATTASGANSGTNHDDHSTGNPSLLVRRPLVTGSVIADQVYEYTTDGVTWLPIPGSEFEIEKGVRMSRGAHVFFFRKQNAAVNPRKFHFEVEYAIGPHHAVTGNRIPVIPAGFAMAGDIRKYASRVIRLG